MLAFWGGAAYRCVVMATPKKPSPTKRAAAEEATPGTELFSTRVDTAVLDRLYKFKGQDRKRKIQRITTEALDEYLKKRGA